MARLVTRSSSRGTLPPNPPRKATKPRVTRSTRSHSKDLGDNEVAVPARKTRSARQGSAEVMESVAGIPNRSQKKTRATPVVQKDLSRVEEDIEEDVQEEEQEQEQEQDEEQDPVEEDAFGPLKTTGTITEAANISGTTAQDTDSQESPNLNTDIIMTSLPSLNLYSNEIIEQIPTPLTAKLVTKLKKLLENPKSKLSMRMRDLVGHLATSIQNFGNELFIDNEAILQKLFETLDPDENFGRPDAIIYKANIAVLLEILIAADFEEEENAKEFMDDLDDKFPSYFVPSHRMEDEVEDNAAFWDQTFEVALDVRTQFVIQSLKHHQGHDNFDPDIIIAQIFLQGGREMATVEVLKMGQPKPIAGLSQSRTNDQKELIAARIDEIRAALLDDTQAHLTREYVDMDELRNKFRWDEFVVKVSTWLRTLTEEYDDYIQQMGGVKKLVEKMSEGILEPGHELTLNFDAIPFSPLSAGIDAKVESVAEKKKRLSILAKEIIKPPSKPSFKSSLFVSSQKKKLTSKGAPPFQRLVAGPSKNTRPMAEQGTQIRSAQDEVIDLQSAQDEVMDLGPDENMQPSPSASAPPDLKKISGRWNSVEKEKNKENNQPPPSQRTRAGVAKKRQFLDAQAGAKKVDFEDDEEDEENDGPQTSNNRPEHGRKRSYEDAELADEDKGTFAFQEAEDEDTESQDEGFEEDKREIQARRNKKIVTKASSQKRPRKPLPANPRSRQGRVQEDGEKDAIVPVRSQAYVETNAQAKNRTLQIRSLTSQIRVPWTPAECEAFVDLIGEFGCGWAQISKKAGEDNLISERHREQVSLKDKARNIKVDYLLSQKPLPENFDMISLGKKERDRVIRAGLNPYRKEGEEPGEEELDENGQPWE